jgi:acetyltransferase-like isoleucine patch superfamily enzyme
MLYPFLAQLVVILILSIYIATLNINNDDVKQRYERIVNSFIRENIILERSELFIEKNKVNNFIIDNIDLPTNFDKTNGYSANKYDILIVDNNQTLRICHELDDSIIRNIYLNHIKGKVYGEPVYIQDNNHDGDFEDDRFNACKNVNDNVYHDYPLRIKSIDVLNNP